MYFTPKLTKGQYTYIASFLKTLAEGIALGDYAAFFLPETLQAGRGITFFRFVLIAGTGLFS
jgi:hypothetical protein